jgi:hypothetical protein
MITEPKCNYQYGCTLPPDEGYYGSCILRYDSRSKGIAMSNCSLEEKIQREESGTTVGTIDLRGGVFPVKANCSGKEFTKSVTIEGAQFHGEARFLDVEFSGEAIFVKAEFHCDELFGASFTAGRLFTEIPDVIESWDKLLVYFNMWRTYSP